MADDWTLGTPYGALLSQVAATRKPVSPPFMLAPDGSMLHLDPMTGQVIGKTGSALVAQNRSAGIQGLVGALEGMAPPNVSQYQPEDRQSALMQALANRAQMFGGQSSAVPQFMAGQAAQMHGAAAMQQAQALAESVPLKQSPQERLAETLAHTIGMLKQGGAGADLTDPLGEALQKALQNAIPGLSQPEAAPGTPAAAFKPPSGNRLTEMFLAGGRRPTVDEVVNGLSSMPILPPEDQLAKFRAELAGRGLLDEAALQKIAQTPARGPYSIGARAGLRMLSPGEWSMDDPMHMQAGFRIANEEMQAEAMRQRRAATARRLLGNQ